MNARYSIAVVAAILAAGYTSVSPAQTTFTETSPAGHHQQLVFLQWRVPHRWQRERLDQSGENPVVRQHSEFLLCAAAGPRYGAGGRKNGVAGSAETLPDPAKNGALRFTNGSPFGHGENGAIVSASAFNAAGIQITFKTVTYRGDSAATVWMVPMA